MAILQKGFCSTVSYSIVFLKKKKKKKKEPGTRFLQVLVINGTEKPFLFTFKIEVKVLIVL